MSNAASHNHAKFRFCTLAFSFFGWALLQTSLTVAGVTVAAHAIVAVLGLTFVANAFRQCRLYWIEFGSAAAMRKRPFLAYMLKDSNAAWGALLLLMGGVLGALVLWGWVTPLLAFAIGLTFVPWSRIPLCRFHFIVSISLIATGAGNGQSTGQHSYDDEDRKKQPRVCRLVRHSL